MKLFLYFYFIFFIFSSARPGPEASIYTEPDRGPRPVRPSRRTKIPSSSRTIIVLWRKKTSVFSSPPSARPVEAKRNEPLEVLFTHFCHIRSHFAATERPSRRGEENKPLEVLFTRPPRSRSFLCRPRFGFSSPPSAPCRRGNKNKTKDNPQTSRGTIYFAIFI